MDSNTNQSNFAWQSLIINQLAPLMLIIDSELNMHYTSDYNSSLFLQSYKPAVSNSLHLYLNKKICNCVIEQLESVIKNKETHSNVLQVLPHRLSNNLLSITLEKVEDESIAGSLYLVTFKEKIAITQSVYKEAFENANEGLLLYNVLLGEVVDINEKFLNIIKYTRKEFLDISFQQLFKGFNSQNYNYRNDKWFFERKVKEKEWLLQTKSNSIVHVTVETKKLSLPNDGFSLVSIRDISNKKRVKAKIDRTIAELKDVFKNTNIGLAVVDITMSPFKLQDCNESLLKLFRVNNKQEFLETPLKNFSPKYQDNGKLSRELGNEFIEKVKSRDKDEITIEWKFIRYDNTDFYCLTKVLPHNDIASKNLFVFEFQDITNLKKSISALNKSEEQFSSLFRYSPSGTLLLKLNKDYSTQLLDCNDALLEMFRCTRDQFMSHTVEQIFPDFQADGRSSIIKYNQLSKKIYTNKAVKVDWQHLRFDGTIMYNNITIFPLSINQKEKLYVLNFIDATDKKDAQLAIAESEEHFKSMFEYSPFGVLYLKLNDDKTRTLLDCNNALTQMFRCSKEQFLNHKDEEIYPEFQDSGKKSSELFESFVDEIYSNRVTKKHWQHIRFDGSRMYNRVTIFPLSVKEDNCHYIINFEDITEKHIAEKAIAKQNLELQTIIDSIPQLFFYKDTENNIKRVNKAAALSIGKLPEEFENQPTSKYFPKDADKFGKDDLKVINSKKSKLNIIEKYERGNTEGWVKTDKVPFINNEGEVEGVLVFASDITKQYETQLALERSEKQFRGMFDESPFGILLIKVSDDFVSTTIDFNKAILEMFRCKREDFLEFARNDMFPEYQLDGKKTENAFKELLKRIKKGSISTFEWQHKRFDQSLVYNLINIYPLNDVDGNEYYVVNFQDISEIFEAQEALKLSEKQFKSLFDYSDFGIFLVKVNKDRKVQGLDCNDALLRMFGCTKEEFLNRPAENHYPEFQYTGKKSLEELPGLLNEIYSANASTVYWQHLRFDNSVMHNQVTTFPLYQKDGSRYYAVNFIDITDQLAAEKAIESQNLQLRTIIDSIPQMFFYKDVKNNILKANRAVAESIGKTPEELEGKPTELFYPKEDAEQYLLDDLEVINSGKSKLGIIEKYKIPDGELIISTDKVPFIDTNGKVNGVLAFASDITEKYNIQKALEKNEQLYRSLFTNSLIGHLLRDENDNVVDANDAFCTMLGYTQDEIIGVINIMEKITLSSDLPKSQRIKEKLNLGILRHFTLQVSYKRKDESIMKALTFVKGNYNENDELINVFISVLDVTNLYKMETALEEKIEELKEKNSELEKYIASNLELENFAYVASHDLKEPVRSIQSFAQLLNRKYNNLLDKDGKEYLDYVISAAGKMNLLIEDLLTFSKVHSQKEIVKTAVFTEKIVYTVSKNLARQVKITKAEIRVHNLPEKIWANELKMTQVLQNLISNALKFVPKERSPVIEISASDTKTHWEFYVKDNGIGISQDYQDKIFVLFKRLHSKFEIEGTGLGLAICKKIVEQHNGSIRVESEVNVGSTFFFTIAK